jgi:hypothetical protein
MSNVTNEFSNELVVYEGSIGRLHRYSTSYRSLRLNLSLCKLLSSFLAQSYAMELED